MAMKPGTRFGPYEIAAAIGAGGMGEVYRARDTKLDRDVAIKLLPDVVGIGRRRFVMIANAGNADDAPRPSQITVVVNWFEELKARAPAR